MKHAKHPLLPLAAGLVLSCLGAGAALADLPRTWPEYKARYQEAAKTPEGALKMHLDAIFCYINPETREEASKMLRYSLHRDRAIEGISTYTAFFVPRMKDPTEQHIFRSYCAGTSPANSYSVDPGACRLNITGTQDVPGYPDMKKIGLKSTGADNVRWITMRQYHGLWYTDNQGGLYMQVRPPQSLLDQRKNEHDPDFDAPAPPPPAEQPKPSGQEPSAQPADDPFSDDPFKTR